MAKLHNRQSNRRQGDRLAHAEERLKLTRVSLRALKRPRCLRVFRIVPFLSACGFLFSIRPKAPKLKSGVADCLLDGITREFMRRSPVRADDTDRCPRSVILRKLASHWIAREGAEPCSCLRFEDVDSHAMIPICVASSPVLRKSFHVMQRPEPVNSTM